MFIQIIQGRCSRPEDLRKVLDRWEAELAPGAEGWLGGTYGMTDDGMFVAVVRFDSRESAMANGARPEQGGCRPEVRGRLPAVRGRGLRPLLQPPPQPPVEDQPPVEGQRAVQVADHSAASTEPVATCTPAARANAAAAAALRRPNRPSATRG